MPMQLTDHSPKWILAYPNVQQSGPLLPRRTQHPMQMPNNNGLYGREMSKKDRIPQQWPLLMSDEMSASYLDVSLSQFRAWVDADHLPKGRNLFGSTVVRWHREALEAVMACQFGRPVQKSAAVSVQDGEDAWERALNAA